MKALASGAQRPHWFSNWQRMPRAPIRAFARAVAVVLQVVRAVVCAVAGIRIVLKRALAPPAGAVSRLPLRAATHALASLCSTHIQKSVAGTHTSCLVMRVVPLRAHYGPPPESTLTSQVATGGGLQPQGA